MNMAEKVLICGVGEDLVDFKKFVGPISVADPDPGSGAFLTPGSGIRDGFKKIKI
jgi:hypothetical protein